MISSLIGDSAGNVSRLASLAARMIARISDARLRPVGFTFSQVPVLAALKDGKALPQSELARLARIEQPSMAQMLARMERDGLIERIDDPQDKRSRLISLSAEAASRLPAAREAMMDSARQSLEGFSEAEVETLTQLLERLNENLDRIDSALPAL